MIDTRNDGTTETLGFSNLPSLTVIVYRDD